MMHGICCLPNDQKGVLYITTSNKVFQEKTFTWDLGKSSLVIFDTNCLLIPSYCLTSLCQMAAVCQQGQILPSLTDVKLKYF